MQKSYNAKFGTLNPINYKIQVACCWIGAGDRVLGNRETFRCEQKNYLGLAQGLMSTPVDEANKKPGHRMKTHWPGLQNGLLQAYMFIALLAEGILSQFL